MKAVRDAYILREFGAVFASVFGLLLLLFSIESFRRIMDFLVQGTFSPVFILRYFGLAVSATLPYVAPVAFLCATTALFSRMAADREVLVLAVGGINPLAASRLLLGVAAAAAVFLCYCNFSLLPLAKLARKRAELELKFRDPLSLLKERTGVVDIPGMAVYVGRVSRGYALEDISLAWTDPSGRRMQAAARRGRARYLLSGNEILFSLEDGTLTAAGVDVSDALTTMRFARYEFRAGLPERYRLALAPPRPKPQEKTLRQLLAGPDDLDRRLEISSRLVYGLAPIVLVFFGVGAGIRMRQRNRAVHLGVGMLASLAFFELLTLGEILARRTGTAGFLWIPLVVFAAAGLRLRP